MKKNGLTKNTALKEKNESFQVPEISENFIELNRVLNINIDKIIEDFVNKINEQPVQNKNKIISRKCENINFEDTSNKCYIYLNDKTIGLIDFRIDRFNEKNDIMNEVVLEPLLKDANVNFIRYMILSDGEHFQIYDTFKIINIVEKLKYESLIKLLIEPQEKQIEDTKKKISKLFIDSINKSNFEILKQIFLDKENYFFENIVYDSVLHAFYFYDFEKNESLEDLLFSSLLDDGQIIDSLYRYTSLESAFQTLDTNSFRMNCIVGMNDTEEIRYANDKIFGKTRDYNKQDWNHILDNNRRFISSFSLEQDNLTQWRLYADDCQGVCLIFKFQPKIISSNTTNFYLKKN